MDARYGDAAVALGHYECAIREWQQAGAWTPLWVTLRNLVELLVQAGAWPDAATLYGAVTAASAGGRSSNRDLPFFVVEHAEGSGQNDADP